MKRGKSNRVGHTGFEGILTLQSSFHRETILCGGWFPFLTFIIEITTNKFNPSSYWKDYKYRIPIHNRIKELMNEGLGYKRIHKVLVKEGFEVGKSPNCVNCMIKKKLKREEFLNQKDDFEFKEFIKNSYKIDNLSLDYLKYRMVPIDDLIGTGLHQKSMSEVPLKKISFYASEDADIVFQLVEILLEKLASGT